MRGFRWLAVAALFAAGVAVPAADAAAAGGTAAAVGGTSPRAAGLPGGSLGPSGRSGTTGQDGNRGPALARAAARVAALGAALTGLRTQAEILTEHYDHEVLLQQQAAAADRAALARAAVARRAERTDRLRLAQQAAADYEADGGPDMAVAFATTILAPQPYLGTLGVQQVLDSQRADLLAASAADEIVTRLFARQAAAALAGQRAAAQAASFLKQAVTAAVTRQTALLKAATAARARLTTAPAPGRPAQLAASVLAGGPPGAAPGVPTPDWSANAGASARQGDEAADWALTQLGKPYRWGAAGPGAYDCSGLALDAWARAGVALLHWTGFQWVAGPHVPLRQLRRGDLVFYATNIARPATIHHVGIYLGHGLMVDAPYTGASVRIDSIDAYPGLIGTTRPASPA